MRKSTILLVSGALCLAGCRDGSVDLNGGDRPLFLENEIAAELGVGGIQSVGAWNLLTIRLTNRGHHFQGTVKVNGLMVDGRSGEPVRSPVTYSAEVEIPLGETREVSFLVRPENWVELQLFFQQRGFAQRFIVPYRVSETFQWRVLAVGEKLPSFEPLARLLDESYTPKGPPSGRKMAMARFCGVGYAHPQELPRAAAAYDPFQLVILYRTALVGVEGPVFDALEGWVQSGGTLVVFPGPSWSAGLPERLKDLLQIRLGDETRASQGSADLLRAVGSEAVTVVDRIQAAERASMVEAGVAIVARRGTGEVITFRFMTADDFLTDPEKYAAIYRVFGKAISRSLSFAGNTALALQQMERHVPPMLFEMAGVQVPSLGKVAGGLALYLLLGFFAPGIVFKKLRRREWTFLVVVLAALLATVGIYQYGLLGALEGREIEEISVVRLENDPGRGDNNGGTFRGGEATSFLGVIDPGLGRFSLEAAVPKDDRRLLLQPLHGLPLPRATLFSDRQGRVQMSPVTLYPNSMAYFRCDYEISDDLIEIRCERTWASDEFYVSLKNHATAPVELYLLHQGRYKSLKKVNGGRERGLYCSLAPSGFRRAQSSTRHDVYNRPHYSDFLSLSLELMSSPEGMPWVEGIDQGTIYLVGLMNTGVFPAVQSGSIRRGVTLFVAELPLNRYEVSEDEDFDGIEGK